MKKILLISLLLITIVNGEQIKLLTEEYPPFQMTIDGKLTGISIEIVNEIQKRVGNTEKIRVFPWNRGYNITLNKKGYALFTTTRTTKREKLFKCVGPISSLKFVLFKLKNNTKKYTTMEDTKNAKSIAVTNNYASHNLLVAEGFKNLNINPSGDAQLNLQKLLNNKVDLWSIGNYAGYGLIKKFNLEDKVVEIKAPPIGEFPYSIAFNIDTPDSTISKWQRALDDLKADGTYQKIIKKYK